MNRNEFFACSIAIHTLLFIVVLFLPPPFPSPAERGGVYYVDLVKAEKRDRGGRRARRAYMPSGISLAATAGAAAKPSLRPWEDRSMVRGVPPEQPPGRQEPPRPAPAEPKKEPAQKPRPSAPPAYPASAAPKERAAPQLAVVPTAQPTGVKADRAEIGFKYQKGWPAPPMVRVAVEAVGPEQGGRAAWRLSKGSDWIIVSSSSGQTPATIRVGVDTSRLSAGYYEDTVTIKPLEPGMKGDAVDVTLMVLPRSSGAPELPHYSWDSYMNGDCKVCHLPEGLMPSEDYMSRPEFCTLCHSATGMARDCLPGPGGHPVMVAAGSGGTKTPTRGTVASGPSSDRMDTHLYGGGKVVCVTCHNVMEKPGEYGRTWEMASSSDQRVYRLSGGGWLNMGFYIPRVYVTENIMRRPKRIKEMKQYLASPDSYTYDEAEGSITFRSPKGRNEAVYVTLTNPYLRVTTENNALCFDCHHENTHEGLSCLTCHQAHGTDNMMGIRRSVRTPDGETRRVVFRAKKGRNSFADGGASADGICEVCHDVRHAGGKNYAGSDCTRCHSHKNGFGV